MDGAQAPGRRSTVIERAFERLKPMVVGGCVVEEVLALGGLPAVNQQGLYVVPNFDRALGHMPRGGEITAMLKAGRVPGMKALEVAGMGLVLGLRQEWLQIARNVASRGSRRTAAG
ncbi:MAG TPA: hypothetical protein VMU33_17265 [Burkholderiaceae bacterium]|nr:hypothetical protein [Burkholderiaceae bacterium]